MGMDSDAILQALKKVEENRWDINYTGYEEDEWTVFTHHGSVNDREWVPVESDETLFGVLRKLV